MLELSDSEEDSSNTTNTLVIASALDSGVNNSGDLVKKVNTRSELWKYFMVWKNDPRKTRCMIRGCTKPDFIVSDGSTGHLQNHLKSHHRALLKETVEGKIREDSDKKLAGAKRPMDDYVTVQQAPSFLRRAVVWIASTYQSLNTVTEHRILRMILEILQSTLIL